MAKLSDPSTYRPPEEATDARLRSDSLPRVADHPQGMAQQVAEVLEKGTIVGDRMSRSGQAQPDQVDDRAVQTPECMTLNTATVWVVSKVKLIAGAPKEHGSVVGSMCTSAARPARADQHDRRRCIASRHPRIATGTSSRCCRLTGEMIGDEFQTFRGGRYL